MKRQFGSALLRVLRAGARLTDEEHFLASSLIAALPPKLQSVVSAQFDSYNLVQREHDCRALNFYRVPLFGKPLETTPLLEMNVSEAPLIRLTAIVEGEGKPLHATLSAVNGHAFVIAFSRPVPDSRTARNCDFEHQTCMEIQFCGLTGRRLTLR